VVAVQAGILYTSYDEAAHGWLQDWALCASSAQSGHLLWRHSLGLDFISGPIMGTRIPYVLRANPLDETNAAAGSSKIVYAVDVPTGTRAGPVYALDATDGQLLCHSFAGSIGSSWSLVDGTRYGCKAIPANPLWTPPMASCAGARASTAPAFAGP
jgi:hypothetical protein